MKKEDFSAMLTALLQKLTETDNVDIRHDQMLTSKEVMKALSISRPTLDSAIRRGDFPRPVKIAGQDRWPSSVINEYIRMTNPQLQAKEELKAQAMEAVKAARS